LLSVFEEYGEEVLQLSISQLIIEQHKKILDPLFLS
jgi:hypothetical protein